MRDVSQKAIDVLRTADLFSAAGHTVLDDRIIQLATWRDAVKAHESQLWAYWKEHLSNNLTSTLHQIDRPRYSATWNAVVDECRPTILACLDKALLPRHEVENKPAVRANASWNILFGIMEIEYSDVVPLGFFHYVFEWYCRGHYPCGWDGEYPEGRLLLY
jgi:hypothetical protein